MTPVRKKFRRRGIFLLPNLLTTAALFAGFYSIVAAVYGDFDKAGAALVAAFVWLSSELELAGLGGLALAFAVTAAAAVLMVSPLPLRQLPRDQLRRPHTVHVFDRYRIDFYTNCPRSTGRLPDPVRGVRGVGPNLLLMAQAGATAGRRNG